MPSEWPYTGDVCILIERDSIGDVDHDVWTLAAEASDYICEAKRRWEGTISQGHMTDRLSATYAEPYRVCVVDSHGLPAELPATKWTISDEETTAVVEFIDEGEQQIAGTGTVRVYITECPISVGDWKVYTEPVLQKVPCTPPCAYGLAHYCAPGDVPATVSELAGKQNVLIAGENVAIEDDVISVPLDAGDGIGMDTSEDIPYLYVKLAEDTPGLDFDTDGGLKVTGGSGAPIRSWHNYTVPKAKYDEFIRAMIAASIVDSTSFNPLVDAFARFHASYNDLTFMYVPTPFGSWIQISQSTYIDDGYLTLQTGDFDIEFVSDPSDPDYEKYNFYQKATVVFGSYDISTQSVAVDSQDTHTDTETVIILRLTDAEASALEDYE